MSHFVEGLGFGGISKEKGRPWGSTGYSAILAFVRKNACTRFFSLKSSVLGEMDKVRRIDKISYIGSVFLIRKVYTTDIPRHCKVKMKK